MHGDRIIAATHSEKERKSVEPEKLVGPSLTRLVGKVRGKNNRLVIVPGHPLLKNVIPCRATRSLNHESKEGDWAVIEMRHHPLKGDHPPYTELTQYTTFGDDHSVSWWVILARHDLEKEAPDDVATGVFGEGPVREDLTALDPVATSSTSTEGMDDALFAKALPGDKLQLTVATADPTARIAGGSKLDKATKIRALTSYLPSFSIPMLPYEPPDDLCSLCANEVHPVLACRMTLSADSATKDNIKFFAATIESKAKLVYDQTSNWLENTGDWQPGSKAIAEQVRLLARICQRRGEWCHDHALVSRDRPDYRFILGEEGEVLGIVVEPCRIANHIIEETMIIANICATRVLRGESGFGTYSIHMGSDPANADTLVALLKMHGLHVDTEEVFTLDGFYKLRRELDAQPTGFLDSRIHRSQSFVKVSAEPGPHFDLGLKAYTIQTSSVRKYGDMISRRLLKTAIKGGTAMCPQDEIIVQMAERRRLNRMTKRNAGDWLHARFLKDKAGADICLTAEIADIDRGGMRARLIDDGAIVFIPTPLLHVTRDELACSQENGAVQIKGETACRVTDVIGVTIAEARMGARSIIARPVA